jgi:hypothetical protein
MPLASAIPANPSKIAPPLRPRSALAEKRLSRQSHQNRREEVESDCLPKAEAPDQEIEGHPAAKHHRGAKRQESFPRRAEDVLNEARSSDRQRHNEDRGAPHKKHGPDGKGRDHLFGQRVLERKEHIGAQGQQDRYRKGRHCGIARDSNHSGPVHFGFTPKPRAQNDRALFGQHALVNALGKIESTLKETDMISSARQTFADGRRT